MYAGLPRDLDFMLMLLARRGNFAESFGDDFFGLKELGIADEFGLSSLTVPKRLLKGKGRGAKEGPSMYVQYFSR